MKFRFPIIPKDKQPKITRLVIVSILIFLFQGCSYKITKWYESDYKIRKPIPSEAVINVRFGTGKINKIFRESKEFIDSAIVKDIEENILTLKRFRHANDLWIDVEIKTLDLIEEPWGLLWFPLVYLGVPIAKSIGLAYVVVDIESSHFANRYIGQSKIEKWRGLYYGYKYLHSRKSAGIAGMALHQAMDQVKQQVEKDAHNFIPAKEPDKPPVESPIPIVRKPQIITKITQADVDLNIPRAQDENRDAVAVIIGNCNYSEYNLDVPNVEYAINDVRIVKEYVIEALGYREGNILYYEDATLTDLRDVFGTESEPEGRLAYTVKPGKSDVFIYYSGHGAPDIEERRGYFVPVNCKPDAVRRNGYPLDLFYNNLRSIEARSFTIVIDACFSGASGNGEMIILAASPIGINITNPALLLKNSAVFTSSSGNEISSWFPEKSHGMFTYFFLRGLQGQADFNFDGQISADELYSYLSDKTDGVIYWARRLFMGRRQTPMFFGDKDMIIRGFVK